jgi:hypothetical protein
MAASDSGDNQFQQRILTALDAQAQVLQLLLDEVRAVSSDVDDIYRTIRVHTESSAAAHSGWEEAALMGGAGGAGEFKH